MIACGLFRHWGGEEGLRKLRLPALRRGLHIILAVGFRRSHAVLVHDGPLKELPKIACGLLRKIKHRSQQPGRAPHRSRLRLLRRPLRRCCQRQKVPEPLGGAKGSVRLGAKCRRRGRALEAHGGLRPTGASSTGASSQCHRLWEAGCMPPSGGQWVSS